MKIEESIFKSYDIRGLYPEEINEKTAFLIGRAFAEFIKKEEGGRRRPVLVVGRDNRFSSPVIKKGLVKGILKQGADVADIGLATTPLMYFSVAHFGYSGGINITASHNPSDYNGLKFVRKNSVPVSGDSGLKKIKAESFSGIFPDCARGGIFKKNFLKEYIKFNFKNFKKIPSLKLAVDTANAVSGIIVPEAFRMLGCEVGHIFAKLDGSFPNHNPDPLTKDNLKEICKKVRREKLDFGVAFDGDGDRIFFIDEKGGIINGDLITALVAGIILEKNPGSKILFDIRSSNTVKEIIKEKGGKPVLWKVGHSFIKEKMIKEEIFFGGEISGHYFLKNHYYCESPLFVLQEVAKKVSAERKALSEIISPYKRYFNSGELNFKVKDKKKLLDKIEKKFKGKGELNKLDGIRVNFDGWWFLVRPSNTEPLIRLIVEARNEKVLKSKINILTKLIRNA